MVRSATVAIENNFSKGLITEATAMNYPENSVVDTDNCVYSKEGRVFRRYGIDYESNYSVINWSTLGICSGASTPSNYYGGLVVKEYEWTTVGSNGQISFIVVQIGNILNFFSEGSSNEFSSNRKSFTVDLLSFQVSVAGGDYGQVAGAQECSFSSGLGYLFVAHPLCNPFYVSYNATADTISTGAITLTVRDFERLNDSLAIDNRPSTLSDLHKYNLFNQGWYVTVKNATPATATAISYWDGARTDFPSNADIWYLFKNSSSLLDSTLFDTKFLGNTPAPNGHYTYNAFSIDRDTTLGTTGLPSVTTSNRPSQVIFFAGRVWYTGVNADKYASKIYFTNIVSGVTDFGRCYQLADPTSETNNELLPNDGGVINIPEIAVVQKLITIGSALIIFATNGVWKIDGPNGVFAADNFEVRKISNTSISSPNSVVIAEGIPFWWDRAGIYTMTFDPQTGRELVNNISEETIQTLINELPTSSLPYVKGTYNNISKTINWIYKSTSASGTLDSYFYDKVLVFNLATASFSPQTVSCATSDDLNKPSISGVIFSQNAHNDPLADVPQAGLAKFITVGQIGPGDVMALTVSQFNSTRYLDWYTFDNTGVNYSSYFITGYRIRGDLLRKFQSNYIIVITETESDSSCFIQGLWDYTNTTANGRQTTSQQVYRDDSTYDYSRSKLKIRGNGYSLQFKFFSETGKPFTLIGWTTSDTGNNVP